MVSLRRSVRGNVGEWVFKRVLGTKFPPRIDRKLYAAGLFITGCVFPQSCPQKMWISRGFDFSR
jgi:hypothetical protein